MWAQESGSRSPTGDSLGFAILISKRKGYDAAAKVDVRTQSTAGRMGNRDAEHDKNRGVVMSCGVDLG
jgi:hypothetical protein